MRPVLFSIGPFNVYAFGIFLALSFILATFFVWKYGRDELSEEKHLDMFLYTCVVSLVCARVFYIIHNFSQFGWNILRFIVVREIPGLSLLTGLAGGFVFLFWYTKRHKYDTFHILDLFAIPAALALTLAKIGEQLGGAGFGRATQFILGVRLVGLPGRYHPVELYEAVMFFILFIIILILKNKYRSHKWPAGVLFYLFSAGAAFNIFSLEFLKTYHVYLYGLSVRQFLAGIWFIISLILFIRKVRPFLTDFAKKNKQKSA